MGVNDYQEASFSLYPNPANGVVHVTSDALHVTNVEVFDIYGKCHLSRVSGKESTITLDVSHLSSGVYFVRLYSNTDNVVVKRLIVIK